MLLTQSALSQMCKNNNGNTTDGLSADIPNKLANLNDFSQLQDQEQGNLNQKTRKPSLDNHFDRDSPTSSPDLHQYISIINPNYPGFQHLAHTLHYNLPNCSDSETEYSSDSCQSTSNTSDNTDHDQINDHNDISAESSNEFDETYRRYSDATENSLNIEQLNENNRFLNYRNKIQFNDPSDNSNVVVTNHNILKDDRDHCHETEDDIDENCMSTDNTSHMNEQIQISNDTIDQTNCDSCQSECSSCCDSNCCSNCQSVCNSCNSCQSDNSSLCEQPPDYDGLQSNAEPRKLTSDVNNDVIISNNNNVYSTNSGVRNDPDNDKSAICQASVVGDLSTEIENAIDEKLSKFSSFQKNQTTKHSSIDHSDRPLNNKMADAFLSNARDSIALQTNEKYCLGSEKELKPGGHINQGSKQDKTQINSQVKRSRQLRNAAKLQQQKQHTDQIESLDGFDVYNIETAMPVIDLDAIEAHLKAAKEEEMRRRTDREEIRRRLAMGPEPENYANTRVARKQSLQSRLQSGMNLQICFMNDNVFDFEGPTPEPNVQDNEKIVMRSESLPPNSEINTSHFTHTTDNSNSEDNEQASLLTIAKPKTEEDFFACQARLQVEARLALAQAKQMAHMQMELERQKQVSSPITDVIRSALTTVGCTSPEHHRRLSRRLLTSMTVAQLQVVVCRLHTQVELFNEQLVGLLMNRDELHMSQDSMLVDIEDLTRYL